MQNYSLIVGHNFRCFFLFFQLTSFLSIFVYSKNHWKKVELFIFIHKTLEVISTSIYSRTYEHMRWPVQRDLTANDFCSQAANFIFVRLYAKKKKLRKIKIKEQIHFQIVRQVKQVDKSPNGQQSHLLFYVSCWQP